MKQGFSFFRSQGREGDKGDPIRYRMKRIGIFGLAVVVTLVLFHGPILTGFASFMTIRDPLERAHIILPLYHERHTVPFAAAELYRRGYADLIAIGRTRPGRLEALGLRPAPYRVWRKAIEGEGVPPEAIVTIGCDIRNEEELARAVANFLGNRERSRVIAVASAPFSRLSRFDLRRGLSGHSVELHMFPVSPREFSERSWWKSRHGWVTYFDVYFLWLIRLLRD